MGIHRFGNEKGTAKLARSLLGGRVVAGGHEHHGDLAPVADTPGGFNAVKISVKDNVHEHKVRLQLTRQPHGFSTGVGQTEHGVTELYDLAAQIKCDDAFVLDDEDACLALHAILQNTLTPVFQPLKPYRAGDETATKKAGMPGLYDIRHFCV
jgi:hypothetical protein